jgi:hypothetical protein
VARRAKKTQRIKRLTKSSRNVTSFTRRAADSFGSEAGGINQKYLLAAAGVIAEQARKNASKFSTRIPAATGVATGDNADEAIVITDGAAAPNALPFETGERHPLWGDRELWYPQPKKPYMAKAAKTASGQALEVYAAQVDELAAEHGYTE